MQKRAGGTSSNTSKSVGADLAGDSHLWMGRRLLAAESWHNRRESLAMESGKLNVENYCLLTDW